jgi:decaprenylphospho-beta-D-erythro-pentofuranosid-2-ulose 2-reductase
VRDALGSVQSVLVLGGSSDIALATVRRLIAGRTRTVLLAARHPEQLDDAVAELLRLGASTVETLRFDADDLESHQRVLADAFAHHGDIDLVLIAFGVLGEQEGDLRDPLAALKVLHTNFLGAASSTLVSAQLLREQGHGALVLLSSVAGERPRRSNFIYGSSKAGIDALAQGLADELAPAGLQILVVRPGMVRTKMTAGLKEAPLTTTADRVADAIVDGLARGAHTVWVPPQLRFVMTVLRHLPRGLFRRLDL